jgi:hypothetical protein
VAELAFGECQHCCPPSTPIIFICPKDFREDEARLKAYAAGLKSLLIMPVNPKGTSRNEPLTSTALSRLWAALLIGSRDPN